MATVKIKFRESTADVNAGKIYMQVIHNREAATIKTAFKISTEQWLNKALLSYGKVDRTVKNLGKFRTAETYTSILNSLNYTERL